MKFSKITIIITILYLSKSISIAQNISFDDLLNIQKSDIKKIEGFLELKKYEFQQKGDIDFFYHNYKYTQHSYIWLNKITESGITILSNELFSNQIIFITTKFSILKKMEKNIKKKANYDFVKSNNDTIYYTMNDIDIVITSEYNRGIKLFYIDLINKKEINLYFNEKLKNEERILNQYKVYMQTADSIFDNKQYYEAIKYYNKAISVKKTLTEMSENNETVKEYKFNLVAEEQIAKARKTIAFLKERKIKIYNYDSLNIDVFTEFKTSIINELINQYKSKELNIKADVNIKISSDTLGNVNTIITDNILSDKEIIEEIKLLIKKQKLNPATKNNYYVNSQSTINIKIELNKTKYIVKKYNVSLSITPEPTSTTRNNIYNFLSDKPIGIYTIIVNNRTINNEDFSQKEILKLDYLGGPSNALLSVLVPGLGVKNVTGGSKSGIKRTLLTYGCIATGIGFKLYSNSEYNKYHEATSQIEMDRYYSSANSSNKLFYVFTATGIGIWIYDIVWVAKKGFENKKEQDFYKNKLNVYYNPNSKAVMMSYKINF